VNSLVLPASWTESAGYAGLVAPVVEAGSLYVLGPGEMPDAQSLEAGGNAATYHAMAEGGGTESVYTLVKDIRDLLFAVVEGFAEEGGE
jgi:hypothetical protein